MGNSINSKSSESIVDGSSSSISGSRSISSNNPTPINIQLSPSHSIAVTEINRNSHIGHHSTHTTQQPQQVIWKFLSFHFDFFFVFHFCVCHGAHIKTSEPSKCGCVCEQETEKKKKTIIRNFDDQMTRIDFPSASKMFSTLFLCLAKSDGRETLKMCKHVSSCVCVSERYK